MALSVADGSPSGSAGQFQPPPPFVVAVVVAFNGGAWIADCIASLHLSTCRLQVLVVDNASADETVHICRQYQDVQLICNSRNRGFGAANNQGMAAALRMGARYVLLVNQDVVVRPAMLQHLISHMESDLAVGVAAPLQMNGAGDAIDSIFLKHYLAESGGRFLSDAVLGSMGSAYSLKSAPAAVWLCSAAMLEKVGGFNPLFFMYCEDDDLCKRLLLHGFKLDLVPAARFNHARGFYGTAGLAPWQARLRRRYIRAHSAFVLAALDLQGRGVVQLWRASVSALLGGLREFMCHADLIAAVASVGAVGAGLFSWSRIAACRRTVIKSGPHWLSGDL